MRPDNNKRWESKQCSEVGLVAWQSPPITSLGPGHRLFQTRAWSDVSPDLSLRSHCLVAYPNDKVSGHRIRDIIMAIREDIIASAVSV